MSKRIYVIDDEESILDAMQCMLEGEGFDVRLSTRGKTLLSLTKDIPDLILLDILLSGEDGREIVKRLKTSDAMKRVPVIMFSAHPNAEESARMAGADDFIAKPFDMGELLQKINQYL